MAAEILEAPDKYWSYVMYDAECAISMLAAMWQCGRSATAVGMKYIFLYLYRTHSDSSKASSATSSHE